MLWRKAWQESRLRFVIGAATLSIFCTLSLQRDLSRLYLYAELPPPSFSAVVSNAVYSPRLELVFVLLCLVLGLGGLQRERTAGTAAFTLALPISRIRLVSVRAGMGFLQVAALAFVPVVLIPTASQLLAGQSYPPAQAVQFAMLFLGWGAVWFAAALFWSTLLGGEYVALLAALLTPFAFTALYISLPQRVSSAFPAGDFFEFMSGAPFIDPRTFVFVEALPFLALAGLAVTAACIAAAAAFMTSRQNF